MLHGGREAQADVGVESAVIAERIKIKTLITARQAQSITKDSAFKYEIVQALSDIRAYDDAGMMIDAEIVEGADAVPLIERFLSDPRAAYLHAHNARRGCFAARIDRG